MGCDLGDGCTDKGGEGEARPLSKNDNSFDCMAHEGESTRRFKLCWIS